VCNHVGFLTHAYLRRIVLHQEICLGPRIFIQALIGLVSLSFVNVCKVHGRHDLFCFSVLMWVAHSESSLSPVTLRVRSLHNRHVRINGISRSNNTYCVSVRKDVFRQVRSTGMLKINGRIQ
jgi:hypothetical protein